MDAVNEALAQGYGPGHRYFPLLFPCLKTIGDAFTGDDGRRHNFVATVGMKLGLHNYDSTLTRFRTVYVEGGVPEVSVAGHYGPIIGFPDLRRWGLQTNTPISETSLHHQRFNLRLERWGIDIVGLFGSGPIPRIRPELRNRRWPVDEWEKRHRQEAGRPGNRANKSETGPARCSCGSSQG